VQLVARKVALENGVGGRVEECSFGDADGRLSSVRPPWDGLRNRGRELVWGGEGSEEEDRGDKEDEECEEGFDAARGEEIAA
jgi:hypothetical protein